MYSPHAEDTSPTKRINRKLRPRPNGGIESSSDIEVDSQHLVKSVTSNFRYLRANSALSVELSFS